jgi:hypothetical protein
MTSSTVATRWIEAGKKLAADAHAEVLCPVREDADLIATDVPVPGSQKIERIMECPKCGARNILLMSK